MENNGQIHCAICGKEDNHENYCIDSITDIMRHKRVCFECAFWIWQNQMDKEGRDFAIIKNRHYVLKPHTENIHFAGMCGGKYRIRFHDGREVICDNLWHQGEIPERFRDIMPDNAEFIQ